MKTLILLLCLAHAGLQDGTQKVAGNTGLECMVQVNALMAKRGDAALDLPDALIQRYLSICKRSRPLAENLRDKFKAAGYQNPEREIGRLVAEENLQSRAALLNLRLPKLNSKEKTAALEALEGMKRIGDAFAKPTESAHLEGVSSAGAGK